MNPLTPQFGAVYISFIQPKGSPPSTPENASKKPAYMYKNLSSTDKGDIITFSEPASEKSFVEELDRKEINYRSLSDDTLTLLSTEAANQRIEMIPASTKKQKTSL